MVIVEYACVALFAVAYASISEWVLHRYVMHRPLGKFRYPFVTHALTHHRIFRADDSYHLKDESAKHKIRMAWWNGAAIVLIGGMPVYAVLYFLVQIGAIPQAGLWGTLCVVIFIVYYAVYEWLHWCMHLPKQRRVERSWAFRRLNGHHLLHHRYMDNNLNVVLPLADWVFGTLLIKARRPFAQVRGPNVPDVQPSPA